MSYADLLKDPRWQKKRLEVMERDNFTCQSCGDTKSTLNVHHAYYEKGKKPWEYPDNTLITWCEKCHESRQAIINYILNVILDYTEDELRGLHAFIGFPNCHARTICATIDLCSDFLPSLNIVSDTILWCVNHATNMAGITSEDEK